MSRIERLTRLSLLLAAALVIQYVEGLLPPLVPGLPVKLGVANACTLIALHMSGMRDALVLQGLRCVLGPLLSGSPVGMLYAASGAALSMLVMLPLNALRLRRGTVSLVGISVAGAFFHSLGQLLMGALLVGRAVLAFYVPMELVSIPSGLIVGLLAQLLTGLVSKIQG